MDSLGWNGHELKDKLNMKIKISVDENDKWKWTFFSF